MSMIPKSRARLIAAAGFVLALAIVVAIAATGRAEVVCDPEEASGECDPGAAVAETAASASSVDTGDLPVEAIRRIIRDYLIEHPEVLLEAQEALRAKRDAQEADAARQAIVRNHAEIFADPEAPVAGNPDGAIVLVEFFDYRCGYCRRVKPTLETLLAENDDLRIVFKEFPILGPESTMAAQAALASRSQGNYEAFHWALMGAEGPLDRSNILKIAHGVGLDVERLARDMKEPAIDALIERNAALAEALGIRGTPGFVIGDRVIGGALPLARFRTVIADARQALQD